MENAGGKGMATIHISGFYLERDLILNAHVLKISSKRDLNNEDILSLSLFFFELPVLFVFFNAKINLKTLTERNHHLKI